MIATAHPLSDEAISRVVRACIAADLRTLRPGDDRVPHATEIEPTFVLKDGPLALDSLEFMTLGTSVAAQFNLFDHDIQDGLLRYRTLDAWCAILQKPPVAPHTEITFSSSGSTGTPKRLRHPLAWLGQEVDAWSALLGDVKRIVVLCPAHHIYGFIWGVLLPARLHVPVLDLPIESLRGGMFAAGDLIVATPPVWRLLNQSGYQFAPGIRGVSSTAPMPDGIATGLLENGLDRLFQIYGSSETAGLAWRDSPQNPYQLMRFWSKPEASQGQGQLVRHCPDGVQRLYPVMDALQWRDERHFAVLGRLDQSIQIGGHNVSLEWIESQIKAHRNVSDVAVRSFTPQAGEPRLKAFVVLTQDDEQARHDFTFWMQTQLTSHARPRALRFGSAIPVNAMGKRADWELEEAAPPA
jgi:long-chain acyl-CoA synthetase